MRYHSVGTAALTACLTVNRLHRAPRRSADDEAHRGIEIGAPGKSKTTGELAIGGGRWKLSLASILIGGDVEMIEEDEDMLAQLAVALPK